MRRDARINLKIARIRKHLSQRKLAELTGLHVQSISDYERGKVNPSFQTMKKISEVLEASVDVLFFQSEEESEVI